VKHLHQVTDCLRAAQRLCSTVTGSEADGRASVAKRIYRSEYRSLLVGETTSRRLEL